MLPGYTTPLVSHAGITPAPSVDACPSHWRWPATCPAGTRLWHGRIRRICLSTYSSSCSKSRLARVANLLCIRRPGGLKVLDRPIILTHRLSDQSQDTVAAYAIKLSPVLSNTAHSLGPLCSHPIQGSTHSYPRSRHRLSIAGANQPLTPTSLRLTAFCGAPYTQPVS